MGAKLIDSNAYLRDPVQRKKAVFLTVSSSSAIDGIHAPFRTPEAGGKASAKTASQHRKHRG
jgi:hypothetical protein